MQGSLVTLQEEIVEVPLVFQDCTNNDTSGHITDTVMFVSICNA